MRKVTVFTGSRAEYGLLNPLIRGLCEEKDLDTILMVSGAHHSEDFGETSKEINTEGISHIQKVILETENDGSPESMAKSYAEMAGKSAVALLEKRPDILLIAGDRYETFAVATVAYYTNIPIAHIFGGDLSQGGHLDDSVRHSITKLSHLHFATNEDSYNRILKLGEEEWRVYNYGSPSVDNFLSGEQADPQTLAEKYNIDISKPIILFTQHPVTTESSDSYRQVKESLEALKEIGEQTIITYPCNDSGSVGIIEALKEYDNVDHFRIRKSLGWKDYLGIMKICSVVAGNSSSGLLETPIAKVPAVNIGSRQAGRLRGDNVLDASYDRREIKKALLKALNDKEFINQAKNTVNPYGSGGVGENIARTLKDVEINNKLLQKKMTY